MTLPRFAAQVAIDARMLGYSGIGTYVSNLVPRVAAAAPEICFTLLGSAERIRAERWERSENLRVKEWDARIYSVREQLAVARVPGFAARIPPDTDLFWAPHYAIPVLYRGKLLVTVHDVCHLAMPEFFPGLAKRLYARLMFAAVRANAAAVICVSHFTAGELSRQVGIPPEIITVVHNGLDEWWFLPEVAPALHARPYLITVGNVKPHKNLRRLVAAFTSLLDKIPHDLLIVGRQEGFITGDSAVATRAAAAGDRIRFTGEVTQDELKNYLTHADALVFPSLYEGFGLPPLEAMACGCPAIVSTAASIPEVCGDAAASFDPHDVGEMAATILKVLQNSALRNEYRARGLTRARSFSWDQTAEKTLSVMRSVLS